jgi:hypothetical protein
MSYSGSSSSSSILSRLIAVLAATVVVALAFGADFGMGRDAYGYKGTPSVGGLGDILPWTSSNGRRKVTPLQDVKMRLSDERKRRVESEKSLSVARTRLGATEAMNQSLKERVRSLEAELRARESEIMDLHVDVARASAASPEMVDQFLSLADEAIHAARFETALALSNDASEMLTSFPPDDRTGRIARLELIRATALIAMGDESGAAASLERLLEVAPNFDLDVSNSSPKLVRVLAEVRAARV